MRFETAVARCAKEYTNGVVCEQYVDLEENGRASRLGSLPFTLLLVFCVSFALGRKCYVLRSELQCKPDLSATEQTLHDPRQVLQEDEQGRPLQHVASVVQRVPVRLDRPPLPAADPSQ